MPTPMFTFTPADADLVIEGEEIRDVAQSIMFRRMTSWKVCSWQWQWQVGSPIWSPPGPVGAGGAGGAGASRCGVGV